MAFLLKPPAELRRRRGLAGTVDSDQGYNCGGGRGNEASGRIFRGKRGGRSRSALNPALAAGEHACEHGGAKLGRLPALQPRVFSHGRFDLGQYFSRGLNAEVCGVKRLLDLGQRSRVHGLVAEKRGGLAREGGDRLGEAGLEFFEKAKHGIEKSGNRPPGTGALNHSRHSGKVSAQALVSKFGHFPDFLIQRPA